MANKYKWNICLRCGAPYLPWKEKQTYCSFWCEILDEEKKKIGGNKIIRKGGSDNMADNEEQLMAKRLSAINLDWKEKYINDIETNGVECWHTVGELNGTKRFYKITPFNKCDTSGMVLGKGCYYVLYEALGIESDSAKPVAVYESLDAAMERAKFQLLVIDSLKRTYVSDDGDVLSE